MEKLKITSVENGNISQALGISEERFNEMLQVMEQEFTNEESTRVTDAAVRIVERLEPNANELFYVGVMIGEIVERQSMVQSLLPSPEEMLNSILRSASEN